MNKPTGNDFIFNANSDSSQIARIIENATNEQLGVVAVSAANEVFIKTLAGDGSMAPQGSQTIPQKEGFKAFARVQHLATLLAITMVAGMDQTVSAFKAACKSVSSKWGDFWMGFDPSQKIETYLDFNRGGGLQPVILRNGNKTAAWVHEKAGKQSVLAIVHTSAGGSQILQTTPEKAMNKHSWDIIVQSADKLYPFASSPLLDGNRFVLVSEDGKRAYVLNPTNVNEGDRLKKMNNFGANMHLSPKSQVARVNGATMLVLEGNQGNVNLRSMNSPADIAGNQNAHSQPNQGQQNAQSRQMGN